VSALGLDHFRYRVPGLGLQGVGKVILDGDLGDTPVMGGYQCGHGSCGDHGGSYASRVHRRGTMPAPPSSLIDSAIGHLVELTADAREDQPGLLGCWPGWLIRGVAGGCATG
jgi:hypothetical protein